MAGAKNQKGRDRAGSAETRHDVISGERLSLVENTAEQGRDQIEPEKLAPAVQGFEVAAEKPQEKHVEKDVPEPAVQKRVANQSPNLARRDRLRVEHQRIGHPATVARLGYEL